MLGKLKPPTKHMLLPDGDQALGQEFNEDKTEELDVRELTSLRWNSNSGARAAYSTGTVVMHATQKSGEEENGELVGRVGGWRSVELLGTLIDDGVVGV